MFYLQGRGDVWVQLPPCFFPGTLPPWGKPTQRGASEVSAATQWKGDSTQHFQIPSPALQSLLDSNITRETDQGKDTARMLPITGVSSGEGCFLFGLFQIGKLYEVQLTQTDQDCRDCLFPVLAGS